MSILDRMDFNPYAFVAPTTPQEYMALLDEGIRLMEQLNQQMDDTFRWLEQNAKPLE
jgi:hypothetical protein